MLTTESILESLAATEALFVDKGPDAVHLPFLGFLVTSASDRLAYYDDAGCLFFGTPEGYRDDEALLVLAQDLEDALWRAEAAAALACEFEPSPYVPAPKTCTCEPGKYCDECLPF